MEIQCELLHGETLELPSVPTERVEIKLVCNTGVSPNKRASDCAVGAPIGVSASQPVSGTPSHDLRTVKEPPSDLAVIRKNVACDSLR
jgi:hypothetical protein